MVAHGRQRGRAHTDGEAGEGARLSHLHGARQFEGPGVELAHTGNRRLGIVGELNKFG